MGESAKGRVGHGRLLGREAHKSPFRPLAPSPSRLLSLYSLNSLYSSNYFNLIERIYLIRPRHRI
jgi:hypothetical protein